MRCARTVLTTTRSKLSEGADGERRSSILTVDSQYLVSPENPVNKKDRGRVAELLAFADSFHPNEAIVRFSDNNRKGKVPLCDLVPYIATE